MPRILFSIVLILSIVGCGTDDDAKFGEPRVLTIIEIKSTSTTYHLETTQSALITAIGLDQHGDQISPIELEWHSSDEMVATVNSDGLVSFLDGGSVIITATSEGISGSVELQIVPKPTLEEFIQGQVALGGIPALSAAMIKGEEIVWTHSFGIHQTSTNTQASENTLYVTSSIAKLVVAVAVMQQGEQGNIDLDEDISTYLGYEVRNINFPEKVITPRLLLTHQAGLAYPSPAESPEINELYTDSAFAMQSWMEDFISPSGAQFTQEVWLNVEPGTTHHSSNLGVTLLAHIVEKTSGLDFRDYSAQEVFSMLGMNNTSYGMNVPGNYQESLLADIYGNNGTLFPNYFDGPLYPAGFLRTSITDWSKFMIAILNGGMYDGVRILSENSLAEMLEIKFPNAGLAYNSGIGLMWRAYGSDKDWLGHTGGGFVTSSADLNLETNTAIIIFTNARGAISVVPDPQGNGVIYDRLHEEVLNY